MLVLLIVASFVSAFALDLLVLAWHRARERGRVLGGTALAAVHEAFAWAPLVLISIRIDGALVFAAAAILGTVAANLVGLRWWRR